VSIIEEGSSMSKRQDGARAIAVVVMALVLGGGAVASAAVPPAEALPPADAKAPPTADEARKFVEDAEARLLDLDVRTARADWVHNTHITDDTEILSAQANERLVAAKVELAKAATRFDGVKLPEDVARKLTLLKLAMTLSAPSDPKEASELTRIAARMEGTYGKGKWCRKTGTGSASAGSRPVEDEPKAALRRSTDDDCLDINALSKILVESRDPAELLAVWKGWHAISPPMRNDYARYVELGNKGARELGFKDMGALWRSKYDMPADDFARELDRLWTQVQPFYQSLHAYVRWKLREKYGRDVVPEKGPIPAHLLGNMWGAGVGEHLPARGPQGHGPGVRPDREPQGQGGGRAGDGALRGALLHLPRLRAAAPDLLGALALHQAPGPRRGVPRQRLGHRRPRRPAHQDVHRDQRGGLHHHPPRAGAQLLPARVQGATLPVP
jgi:peptidyl-dipeptidase A